MCYQEPSCVSMNFGPKEGGNFTCELNHHHSAKGNQSSPVLRSKKGHIYLAIENPCSSSPCLNNGTCQAGYTAKGFRCKCPIGFTGARCKTACSFDFEDGIGEWEMTGTAFIYQPTFGDNPAYRHTQSAQQQGSWWIGGAEKRPRESDAVGVLHPEGGDEPHGTLTSPCFSIVGKSISFLIGGGCKLNRVRAELIVDNKIARTETGKCLQTIVNRGNECMVRAGTSIKLVGHYARVRLVNNSTDIWAHKLHDLVLVELRVAMASLRPPIADFNSFKTDLSSVLGQVALEVQYCYLDLGYWKKQHLPNQVQEQPAYTFSLSQISKEFVQKELLKIKENKPTGLINLHDFLIKDVAPAISKPLTVLLSRGINEGSIPPDWKHATLTPIHKTGSKANPANFRPISLASKLIWSFVSSLFERLFMSVLFASTLIVERVWQDRGFDPNLVDLVSCPFTELTIAPIRNTISNHDENTLYP
ncbi:Hepatocyte growth factor activator [Stylophora pistillata]|uniref:Hepatocyte growth factor activator n=1 Tax=Stylophora pistillata TaxID=50429 RepID=A0A2B4SJQ0_STYPI|nr:Hepatocyte growth factor activator [Stylophora pistillata]